MYSNVFYVTNYIKLCTNTYLTNLLPVTYIPNSFEYLCKYLLSQNRTQLENQFSFIHLIWVVDIAAISVKVSTCQLHEPRGLISAAMFAQAVWTNEGLCYLSSCHLLGCLYEIWLCTICALGPISLTFFPSQFKFDGNFVSLSFQFIYSNRYKILYMVRQLSSRGMCKNLLWSDGQ